MKFKSIQDIIDYFNLKVDESNIGEVRSALIKLLADNHPDKSGGNFTSKEQKEKYNEIKNALDKIDLINSQHNSLVTVDQITDIIKAITDVFAPRKENEKSNIEVQIKNELRREIKANYNPIKIGSGTVAIICTGLISFSKTLVENPIFAPLLKIPYINFILLYFLILSVFWFLFTWSREKRDEQRKEWLFSEDAKLIILAEVIESSRERHFLEDKDKIVFSFRDFVNAIRGKKEARLRPYLRAHLFTIRRILYGSSIINISIAEQIARYHISDLENRKIIKKYSEKSLELLYEIDRDLVR